MCEVEEGGHTKWKNDIQKHVCQKQMGWHNDR